MPMSGGMPPPMSGGFPAPGPMTGNPYANMPMSGPMNGFGPEMHNTEFRHAPQRNRFENQEIHEDKKVVKDRHVLLPDGEKIPSGSNKFELYGALEDINREAILDQTEKLMRRRRINCIPALNALFLPWVTFLIVFSLSSFYFHYTMPFVVMCANSAITVIALTFAYLGFKNTSVPPARAFYQMYMGLTIVCAVCLGWLLGDLNFWFNMQPAYNVDHLATYTNVNPSTHTSRDGQVVPTRGKRYQDAGKIYFAHNAVIDYNRSMSFKMGDLYCVAPIIDPSCKKNCGYDFWAVGMNCCAEDVADFRCGEYKNPAAKSGLRLMHNEQRPNFRLAVLEAEGVHKIVSTHPVFFYWLHDPVKELSHIKKKGFKEFVLLMIVSFFLSALAAYLSLKYAREKFQHTPHSNPNVI